MRCTAWLLTILTFHAAEVAPQTQQTVAYVGATVFVAPNVAPIDDGVVVVANDRIAAVGTRRDTPVPRGARVVDASNQSILAGFWNAHVHLSEPHWQNAAAASTPELTGNIQRMLTRWGFVRVVDTGSFPEATQALRKRIRSGEIAGPEIITAGMPFVAENGTPFYIAPLELPELTSPAQAAERVQQQLAAGIDVVKLFTASPISRHGDVVMLPLDIVRAASAAAHARKSLVFAHPTSNAGALRAAEGGVDVLAHTTPDGGEPWSNELIDKLLQHDISVTPTLKLWTWELTRHGVPPAGVRQITALAQQQIKAFVDAGGSLLFGTDVGYMTDYDPTAEYELLAASGISFAQILAALTTEPARKFGVANTGTIEAGRSADLVIVNGRPDRDITRLADVVIAMRAGRILSGANQQ